MSYIYGSTVNSIILMSVKGTYLSYCTCHRQNIYQNSIKSYNETMQNNKTKHILITAGIGKYILLDRKII